MRIRLGLLVALLMLVKAAGAEEASVKKDAMPAWRSPSLTASIGVLCVNAAAAASCLATPRVGVDFGWIELHVGALAADGVRSTGRDELGPIWHTGSVPLYRVGPSFGAELGTPWLTVWRRPGARLALAARARFDGGLAYYPEPAALGVSYGVFANTYGPSLALRLPHRLLVTARAGAGVGVIVPRDRAANGDGPFVSFAAGGDVGLGVVF